MRMRGGGGEGLNTCKMNMERTKLDLGQKGTGLERSRVIEGRRVRINKIKLCVKVL